MIPQSTIITKLSRGIIKCDGYRDCTELGGKIEARRTDPVRLVVYRDGLCPDGVLVLLHDHLWRVTRVHLFQELGAAGACPATRTIKKRVTAAALQQLSLAI